MQAIVQTDAMSGSPVTGGPPEGFVPWLARLVGALASRRVWMATTALFVVFAGVFFVSSAPFAVGEVEAVCGVAPLDVRFHSSADDVMGFLEACGPDGRAAYRDMQLADLAYPMVFALFMASSIALVARRLLPGRPGAVVLGGLGLLAAVFDYAENVFAWRALAAFPRAASTNGLVGVASAAKTVTSWTAGTVLLIGLGALAARAIGRWRPGAVEA